MYNNYVLDIKKLISELNHEYIFLIKNDSNDVISDGYDVSEYNIDYLLNISDFFIVFNSDMAIRAMMWDIPILVCGEAFYNYPELVTYVKDYSDLKKLILTENIIIDIEARKKFLHHLKFKLYSELIENTETNSSFRKDISYENIFKIIRFDGIECKYYRSHPTDNWESMLFDRYLWEKRETMKKLFTKNYWRETFISFYRRMKV